MIVCESKFETPTHIDLQRDRMDSKSVELRFMSVRVGLGVPLYEYDCLSNRVIGAGLALELLLPAK